ARGGGLRPRADAGAAAAGDRRERLQRARPLRRGAVRAWREPGQRAAGRGGRARARRRAAARGAPPRRPRRPPLRPARPPPRRRRGRRRQPPPGPRRRAARPARRRLPRTTPGHLEGEDAMNEWNGMAYEGKDNLLRVVRHEAEQMLAMAEAPGAWEAPTACV